MRKIWLAVVLVPMWAVNASAATESLDKLADDFWTWRAKYAPFTGDDVNRMERPGGIRNWSRAAIDQRRKELEQFEASWKKIDASSWPISKQVDYKLVGSALSRVPRNFMASAPSCASSSEVQGRIGSSSPK